MIPSLLLAFSLFCPQGSTVYVPDNYPTIQGALIAVASGDTVIVRPGTYTEYGLDYDGKSILLQSEKGAAQTIIDGMSSGSVVDFHSGEGPGAVLDGFTITNGINWDGGGISIVADVNGNPSSPTIKNCVIEYNVGSGGGGGMQIKGGSQTLVHNCLIQHNTTTYYHGAGVVIFDSSPVFSSCTVRWNVSAATGGGFSVWDATSYLFVTDSILYGNTPSNIDRIGPAQILAEYTLSEGDSLKFWFGTGCIDADPLFTAGPLGDAYLSHLASGQVADSPAIDAGNPATVVFGTTRTDGFFDRGIVDMGYHYPIKTPVLAVTNLVAGAVTTIQVSNNNPGNTCLVGFSLLGGGPINSPYGPVYLTPPYTALPPMIADPQGVAALSVPVPPTAAGRNVWFHGLNQTMGLLTNPLAETVQ